MTNKISVSREKHEIKFLIRPRLAGKVFCAECGAKVNWLVPEEAMILANISLREVFQMIERCELHFAENADGFLIVCAESLTTKARK